MNLLINNRSLSQDGIDVGFQKCEIHVNEFKECLSILVVFMYHLIYFGDSLVVKCIMSEFTTKKYVLSESLSRQEA